MLTSITDIVLSILYTVTLFYTIFWLITLLEEKPDKKVRLKKYPFVTVAIPAYNEEETIEETIDSVKNLSYPKNKFEIIVINDGSTDKPRQITERYIQINQTVDIKLINQKNSGK